MLTLLPFAGLSVLLASATEDVDELPMLALETAITQALNANIGLQIERLRPLNARDSEAVERAAFDPRFTGSYRWNENQAAARTSALDSADVPRSESWRAQIGAQQRLQTGAVVGADTAIQRTATNNLAARNPDYSSDVGISVRQPLLRGAGQTVNLAPLARARIGTDRALDIFKDTILETLASVETAYWNLAFVRARRNFLQSSLELAESIREENKERERLGLVTPLEVLQAEAEVVSRQEELILAEREIEDAIDRLYRLIGENVDAGAEWAAFQVEGLPGDLPENPPMVVIARRAVEHDLRARAQERTVEIQRINRMLASNETRPDLDLILGIRYLGRDQDGPQSFRSAYSGAGYNAQAGVEVSVPWDFRASRARERQANRDLEREELTLADLRQQRSLTIREAWRSVDSGLKRIEVTRLALELNEKSFEQERARFSAGTVAYRRVLEAQRDLDQARLRNLNAVIETLRSQVRLARLDGGILERHGLMIEGDLLRVDSPVATRISTIESERTN